MAPEHKNGSASDWNLAQLRAQLRAVAYLAGFDDAGADLVGLVVG